MSDVRPDIPTWFTALGEVELDPRLEAELDLLAREVVTSQRQPAPSSPKRRRRRLVLAGIAAAVGVGGVAGVAVSSNDPLYNGYVGTDTLIDTTSWKPEWQSRVDSFEWPNGTNTRGYVEALVSQGMRDREARPSRDLDHEVLSLNGCAWLKAYVVTTDAGKRSGALAHVREALGSDVGQRAANSWVIKSLNKAAAGDAEPEQVYARSCAGSDLVVNATSGIR